MGKISKLSTKIYGINKIFKGGIDYDNEKGIIIVIRGAANTHRTLLGIQLLYGLALSAKEKDVIKNPEMYYVSEYADKENLDDLIVNTLIAAFARLLVRKKIENPQIDLSELDGFTRFFFNTRSILFESMLQKTSIPVGTLIKDIKNKPEDMIADGILYYHSRTGGLHFRTPNHVADETNIVYKRACNTINTYVKRKNKYPINKTEDLLQFHIEKISVVTQANNKKIPDNCLFLGLELDDAHYYTVNDIRSLIKSIKKRKRISVLIVNDGTDMAVNDVDLVIDLTNEKKFGYIFHYMTLFKNSPKYSMTSSHQYKMRDFGIEVFPNLHTYYLTKKSFHRSFIYTHASVLGDTYPQYLTRRLNANPDDESISYDDYLKTKEQTFQTDLESMLPPSSIEYISYDLLNKIFMYKPKTLGLVTAVVGGGNTYKRFLTFGSAFSSAVKGDDILLVLLNKEKGLIQRQMACPARFKHCAHKDRCISCYKFFHLMNIYSEFISAEEFVYILNQHIILSYGHNRQIRRIIIDGLQTIDYSFPFLKDNHMFLSTVMNLCREKNISLYVISDKNAELCRELVTLADNVVYTEKNSDGKPRIFIERCSGHYNPPSKMYCGEIKNVSRVFECKEQYIKECEPKEKTFELSFNPLQIKEMRVQNREYELFNPQK